MYLVRRITGIAAVSAVALLTPVLISPVAAQSPPAPTITKSVNATTGAGSTGYATSQTTTPGATLNYLLNFTFTPAMANGGATITDVLQPGQTPVSYELGPNTNANCQVTAKTTTTNTITCQVASANENNVTGAGTIYINTQVNANFAGPITNTATITPQGVAAVSSNTTTVTVQGTTTPPPTTTGQYTICGLVTAYIPSGATTGSLTVLGQTFVLATNVAVTGTIVPGTNECLTLTFANNQVVAIVSSANLATMNTICGIYAPVTGSTTSIVVGGYTYGMVTGTTFPFTLVPGQYYCFLVSPNGYVTALLSFIPTRATAVAIHQHPANRWSAMPR